MIVASASWSSSATNAAEGRLAGQAAPPPPSRRLQWWTVWFPSSNSSGCAAISWITAVPVAVAAMAPVGKIVAQTRRSSR